MYRIYPFETFEFFCSCIRGQSPPGRGRDGRGAGRWRMFARGELRDIREGRDLWSSIARFGSHAPFAAVVFTCPVLPGVTAVGYPCHKTTER